MHIIKLFILIFVLTVGHAKAGRIDPEAIETIRNYLKTIDNLVIDFTQTNLKEKTVHGKLLIAKPYNFRCNYYAPYPLLITGNEKYISIYDYQMNTLSRTSAVEHFLYILVSEKPDFAMIHQAIKKDDELLLGFIDQEVSNYVTFRFSDKPELKNITIDEQDGNVIKINFYNHKRVKKIDRKLFSIQNPNVFGPTEYLDKKKLKKYYWLY